jgi:hypothetical protein
MIPILFRAAKSSFLAAVMALAVSAGAVPGFGAQDEPANNSPTLVFITKSDACDCVVNLCVAGEQEVINFLGGQPFGFRLERIDLAEKPEQGRAYRAVTLPVVILKETDGRSVARFDSFFTESDFYAAWEKHRKAGAKP